MKTKSKSNSKSIVRLFTNPSAGLLAAAESILGSGYTPTCRIEGEEGLQYDQGFSWAEIRIPQQLLEQIHTIPETPYRHEQDMLLTEYNESRKAKGLPWNAPPWAHVLNSQRFEGNLFLGVGVEVFVDGDFKVVQLLHGKNEGGVGRWHEQKLFATTNGESDDTEEYYKLRSANLKKDEMDYFISSGLNEDEGERLFATPKQDRVPGQKNILINKASKFRALQDVLSILVGAKNKVEQAKCLGVLEIIEEVSSMTYPEIQILAKNALRIFHGIHWVDFSKKVSEGKEIPIYQPQHTQPIESDLVSIAPPKNIPVVERRGKSKKPRLDDPKLDDTSKPVDVPKPKTAGDWSPLEGNIPHSAGLKGFEQLSAPGSLFVSALGSGNKNNR